jgi:hypothetical protein
MALFKKKGEDAFLFGNQSEEVILEKLRKLFKEADSALKHRRDKWRIHYKYWTNSALSERRPTYKSDIRVNYCWVTTEVKLPHMTQNLPRVNFVSFDKSPEGESRAEQLGKLIGNALWHKLEINETSDDTCLDAMLYDGGFYKVGWDPDAESGIGEVFVSSVEPFKVLPDPFTKKMETGRYVWHIEPYPVDELKQQYPKHAEQISPDKKISTILFEERRFADRTPTSVRSGLITDSTEFEVERAFRKECWLAPRMCDQTIMGEEKTEGGEPVPKYRHGRVISTINDVVICDDKPNPYNDEEPFPFVMQKMHKAGNELWGMGDIEQLIPLQDALNHAYQQSDDIIAQTANIGWQVDPSLGEKNIKRLALSLPIPASLKVVPPGKLVADTPPQVPQYLDTRKQDIIQRIYDVTGISEILQGSGRVTHRTARGIERLFEAGSTRIGKSIQYYEGALKKVALKMAARVNQFYTEDRVLAVIGGNGQVAGVIEVKPGSLKGKYEVTIDSGAALPRDKQSRADLVFELMKNQVFEMAMSPDPAAKMQGKIVLDTVEFPGREALLNFQPPPPKPSPAPTPQPAGALPPGAPPLPGSAGPGAMPGAMPGAGGQALPPEIMEMMMAAQSAGLSPEEFMAQLAAALGGAAPGGGA